MTRADDANQDTQSTDASDPAPQPDRLARRGALFARAVNGVRKKRATIRVAVISAATTLAVLAALVALWRLYGQWREGRIELTTEGEPVIVQVLEESSDHPVGEPIGVVDRAMLTLPEGEYRLRVDGRGRLGRTYRFSVNRGETQAHAISIDEGRLLGGEPAARTNEEKRQRPSPIPLSTVTGALELTPGKADLFGWTADSLVRRDGATGKVIWDVPHPAKPRWRQLAGGSDLMRPWLSKSGRGGFVEPAPDLNGDGTGDLLLRGDAAFVAYSGKTGAMLWKYFAGLNGQPKSPSENDEVFDSLQSNTTAGEPAMADVNRDGIPDIIATFVLSEPAVSLHRRIVVGISGRSGEKLWAYTVEKWAAKLPETSGDRPAVLVQGRQRSLVAYAAGPEWIGLDPATGKPCAGPIDLGFDPVVPVQYVDLDGESEPEILALIREPGGKERMLRAFSIKSAREIWSHSVDDTSDRLLGGDASRALPLIADLDGDGRPEILVRDAGPMPPLSGYRGVRLLDGRTGATRWWLAMGPARKSVKDPVAEAIAAPDLDGDGYREVVTVSAVEEGKSNAIYVDAISGRDGLRLWWWKLDTQGESTAIGKPAWWEHGPDGWPLLALRLGGETREQTFNPLEQRPAAQPNVHLLEASTGRERYRLPGLSNASFADLDGDGLTDLWGEVDGELRAFRGEVPEAWRALGRFDPAGSPRGEAPAIWQRMGFTDTPDPAEIIVGVARTRGVDFDGDGVADALIGNLKASGNAQHDRTGSHLAMARSGRDGRLIWKTQIDPRANWLDPNSGESYELESFPMPSGDVDGDGTPDVIVKKGLGIGRFLNSNASRSDIELLSGRTGARIWSGGRWPSRSVRNMKPSLDWAEPCVVDANHKPDVIVGRYAMGGDYTLSRISGSDGRALWDVAVASDYFGINGGPHFIDDLDGDRGKDALVLVPRLAGGTNEWNHELVAVSLHDGKRLWSQKLRIPIPRAGQIQVGDIDGDGRPEVVALAKVSDTEDQEPLVRAFDGRDGTVRWTWKAAAAGFLIVTSQEIALARFDGNGKRSVCVGLYSLNGIRRIIVIDGNGKERARRELGEQRSEMNPGVLEAMTKKLLEINRLGVGIDESSKLTAADLDGDGRDELLTYDGAQLHAWDANLKELWFWPTRFGKFDQIVPAAGGRPRELVLRTGVGLDAATGQARWTGRMPLSDSIGQFMPSVLDPGDSKRAPLLIANGLGSTVCQVAMPTAPDGSIAPPRGNRVLPARNGPDPRWARPLPWLAWLDGALSPTGFLVSGCLALVNVFLPLLMLRLVTRRRRSFNMWALMVLPLAAALPLMVHQTISPWLPVLDGPLLSTETRVFLTGTLAGIPIVYFVLLLPGRMVRFRRKAVLAVLALTIIMTLLIAIAWILIDRRFMATRIEHYEWDQWTLVFLPGAYVAAIVWAAGRGARWAYRFVRRGIDNERGRPAPEQTGEEINTREEEVPQESHNVQAED